MEVVCANASGEMLCPFNNKIKDRVENGAENSGGEGVKVLNAVLDTEAQLAQKSAESQWTGLSVMIPEINMDLFGFESYTLLIRRSKLGFGFTVLGSCPVQVGRIEEDSPAQAAGLLVEDCIVRINGQNVSRSAADSVARIVRDSEKYVIMEIYRLPLTTFDSPPIDTVSTPWLPHPIFDHPYNPPFLTSTSISSAAVTRSNSTQARSPFTTITNVNSKVAPTAKNDVKRDAIQCRNDFRHQVNIAKRDLTPARNSRVNQAAMQNSVINSTCLEAEPLRRAGRRQCQAASSSDRDSGLERSGSAGDRGSVGSVSSGSDRCSGLSGEKENSTKRGLNCGRARIDMDDCQSICSIQESIDSGKQIDEASRREAVEALVSCEETFLLDVQLGIKRYLRPIKNHGIIAIQDHAAVFQNIEKIAALSEYHVRQLQSRRVWRSSCEREMRPPGPTHDDDVNVNVGDVKGDLGERGNSQAPNVLTVEALSDVYITKAEEFCEAYETYCGGVKEAFRILIALKRKPDVDEYLRMASIDCRHLTLSAFLQSPLQHIRDIVLAMQRLLNHTVGTSIDHKKLKSVIQGIRSCCHRINESNTQRYGSSLTLASRADTSLARYSRAYTSLDERSRPNTSCVKRSTSSLSSSSASTESMSSSTFAGSVVSSIDTELLEIQGRLVFPPDIPSFQLATPSHHLIYSGPLQLLDTDTEDSAHSSAVQLLVLLLSDLILLTRPDPDTDTLHVIEEPIILRDIVGSNFNCPSPCEFLLCVETPMTGLHETWEPFPVLLRAPSVELKCTWKNILEQRIFTCKSLREQTIVNKNISNVV